VNIALVIATTGRPAIVDACLKRFAALSRRAERTLVVCADAADAPAGAGGAEIVVAPGKGSSLQRNHGLDLLDETTDVVAFVDDDFVPAPGFFEGIERLFRDHPDIVAASGHLIADGIHGPGIRFETADGLVAAHVPPERPRLRESTGTYGCNMVYRRRAAAHVRFDERLPLYGWLEDTDFSAQFARVGRVVRTDHFAGVHLGVKSGRSSGVRVGYSQIANPLYLVRKGTVAPGFALQLAARNFASNLVKAARPEPLIDRAGRLRGNLMALVDALRGRADPGRILDL
jgi:GT2 family glycosyltransferase